VDASSPPVGECVVEIERREEKATEKYRLILPPCNQFAQIKNF